MTFHPVLPTVVLLAIAVVVIAMRLLTMRRLHATAGARWTTVGRWAGLTLAILLILIAAARPGIEHGERGSAAAQQSAENTNVFFLVDRSADSAIEDHGDRQPRMSAIRNDIESSDRPVPGGPVRVIAFASRPSLDWPLSEDAWSLRPEVARLTPYPASDDDRGCERGRRRQCAALPTHRGRTAVPRLREPGVLLRFRCPGSRAPQGEFEPTAGSVDGGAVFGYGAAQKRGGPAPGRRTTRPALCRPRRRKARRGVRTGTREAAPSAGASAGVADRTELYWVFTMLAAVLLLFELFASIRDIRRTRLARRDVAL